MQTQECYEQAADPRAKTWTQLKLSAFSLSSIALAPGILLMRQVRTSRTGSFQTTLTAVCSVCESTKCFDFEEDSERLST